MYSQEAISNILNQVAKRKLSARAAYEKLKNLSYEVLSFARLDHHRRFRKNIPEAIYAPGKTDEQLVRICRSVLKTKSPLLVTRLEQKKFSKLKKLVPRLQYSKKTSLGFVKMKQKQTSDRFVAIVTAGTSDIAVAEEARISLEVMGAHAKPFYDLGIAGLQRLLDHIGEIEQADVVICIAGMEGALPSVLAGLVSKPVIAVPTSVGYGSGFKGITPLLAMLNSCAQGVAVVNIDSGFNAACFARLILNDH